MVGMNRVLSSEIETVFLMADNSFQSIASKLVKEIADWVEILKNLYQILYIKD